MQNHPTRRGVARQTSIDSNEDLQDGAIQYCGRLDTIRQYLSEQRVQGSPRCIKDRRGSTYAPISASPHMEPAWECISTYSAVSKVHWDTRRPSASSSTDSLNAPELACAFVRRPTLSPDSDDIAEHQIITQSPKNIDDSATPS